MGKKDKKKGKGIEKTAAKTEKKLKQKLKRELAGLGEEDIEVLITKCQEDGKRNLRVSEETTVAPSPRSSFSLTAHPDKEELILFGGDYHNGIKTIVYNDLYFYCIKKKEWRIVKAANPPTPRSGHQAVALAQEGGQLWVFGGEYASPSEKQFYHYRDLWVYHLKKRQWQVIAAAGGPSARSGHRMLALKRNLVVFGGFFDNNTSYICHNDVHIFSLDSYTWMKLTPKGIPPSPRSASIMGTTSDGKILVYGGYYREKVQNEDKGRTKQDMFLLSPSKHDDSWKWVSCKVAGCPPSLRCGIAQTMAANNILWLFGGVHDNDDTDEDIVSVFYNDLYKIDVDNGRFFEVSLKGKKIAKVKKRSEQQVEDIEDKLEAMEIGGATAGTTQMPCGRMSSGLAVVRGKLYLYGGTVEADEKFYTLDDLYCLDTHSLSQWECLQGATEKSRLWEDSEKSSDDDSDDDDSDGNESDDEMDEA